MGNGSGVAVIFLLLFGMAAVAVMAGNRGQVVETKPVYTRPARQPARTPTSYGYAEPVRQQSAVLYENEERIQFVRGPDRLLEEIIWHRKVTQDVG